MITLKEFQALYENSSQPSLPEQVTELISALSSREETYAEPWPEQVLKQGSSTKMNGLRMFIDGVMIRVNWYAGRQEIDSIDFWTDEKGLDRRPKSTAINSKEEPIVSNIEAILALVKNFRIGRRVNEAKSAKPREPRIEKALPEETMDPQQPEGSTTLDPGISVFDDLRELVKMVLSGVNDSLIISGRGGIGKTHTVLTTLDDFAYERGDDFVVVKGTSTALSMYSTLFVNNGKIIIFDDCDSIFRDPDGLNILKAALDTYSEREISWLSRSTYDPEREQPTEKKSVPNRFVFNGKIIFITNRSISELDEALRTRCITIDVSLSQEQMLEIMDKNLSEILPSESMDIKREVFDFLRSEYPTEERGVLNVRTLIKAIKIRLSRAPNWKELVVRYA